MYKPFTEQDIDWNNQNTKVCLIKDCRGTSYAYGVCSKHIQKIHRRKDPILAMLRANKNTVKACSILGCAGKYHAKGLCLNHYKDHINGTSNAGVIGRLESEYIMTSQHIIVDMEYLIRETKLNIQNIMVVLNELRDANVLTYKRDASSNNLMIEVFNLDKILILRSLLTDRGDTV